jgi:hypothetical protein
MIALLPLAAAVNIDSRQYKIDLICYPAGAACRDHEKWQLEDYTSDEIKRYFGAQIWGSPSNLSSSLRASKNYLVFIDVLNPNSGIGEDVVDLSQFTDRKWVMLYTNWVFVDHGVGRSMFRRHLRSVVDMLEAGETGNWTEREWHRGFSKLMPKQSQVPVKPANRSRALPAQDYYGVLSSSDGSSSWKIDFLMVGGDWRLATDLPIPAVTFLYEWSMVNPEQLKANYGLLPSLYNQFTWKDVGIYGEGRPADVIYFRPDGWEFSSDTRNWMVNTSEVPGKFSILVWTSDNPDADIIFRYWPVTLSPGPGNEKIEVPGINLSVQRELQNRDMWPEKTLASEIRLRVTFSDDWDDRILNNPEIILEADSLSEIEVIGEPKNAVIVKKTVSERPVGGGLASAPRSGYDDDHKGLSGGAIAGIAIAALVVVGATAFGVWFVVRKDNDKDGWVAYGRSEGRSSYFKSSIIGIFANI